MTLVALGIILTLCGAASIALSMVFQRYALSYPEPRVPVGPCRLPRLVAWFVALICYGAANGFYAVALNFGPLSLLAGVFSTLLVFNMIFARWLLGEVLTPPKTAGSVLILLGVCCAVAGAPTGVPTSYTPDDVERLLRAPTGAAYFAVLLSSVALSVLAILVYERRFPYVARVSESGPLPSADAKGSTAVPPVWLDRVMSFVYPASLGIDEGIAHLAMKGSMSMLASCSAGDANCEHPALYVFVAFWICCSVATSWWLKVVFERYETTSALPVEYGMVNAVSTCSGLIFYEERRYLDGWQLALSLVGLLAILAGIGLTRMTSNTVAVPKYGAEIDGPPIGSTSKGDVIDTE